MDKTEPKCYKHAMCPATYKDLCKKQADGSTCVQYKAFYLEIIICQECKAFVMVSGKFMKVYQTKNHQCTTKL